MVASFSVTAVAAVAAEVAEAASAAPSSNLDEHNIHDETLGVITKRDEAGTMPCVSYRKVLTVSSAAALAVCATVRSF